MPLTVKLYFEPYPDADADGLRIEESVDGVAGWGAIEDLTSGQIGTYPNWISSFITSNATSDQYWFRIAWKVGGVIQNYSDPRQVSGLAEKYTTPDQVKDTTRMATIKTADTLVLQELIVQAYYMVQGSCGPFDETDPGFIEVAPLAMRLYVEYLFVTQDPLNLSALAGTIEEKIGSYKYRKSEKAVEMYANNLGGVPDNVEALMCPYNVDDDTATETITTEVFTPTPWFDGEETDLDKKYVVTSADPMRPALDSDSYERAKKYPSV